MKKLFIFMAGAAIGSVVAAKVVKTKYENLIEEEIQSVRDVYKKKLEETKVESTEEDVEEVKEEVEETQEEVVEERNEYRKIINYNKYAKTEEVEETQEEVEYDERNDYDDPYVIDPEDFGCNGEYATQTLTYFADGVVVDDVDEVVEQPEIFIGDHHIEVFRDFEATAIYVRNEWNRTDYEILKDDWFWSDIDENGYMTSEESKKPHQV